MTDFSNFLSNFAPWFYIGAARHRVTIKKRIKKLLNNNEEENSVQSRISRHVAEFW